jgi:hypothetical protein
LEGLENASLGAARETVEVGEAEVGANFTFQVEGGNDLGNGAPGMLARLEEG